MSAQLGTNPQAADGPAGGPCGLVLWRVRAASLRRTLLALIYVVHEHPGLQQVARAIFLAEHDDEGGLLGLTVARRAGRVSLAWSLVLWVARRGLGANAGHAARGGRH